MARTNYNYLLEQTRDDVERMSRMVRESLRHALHALERWDSTQAQWVIDGDARVNQLRYQIEDKIEGLLATQQPIVATDLRLVSGLIAVTNELERVGDYAKDIARLIRRVVAAPAVMDVPTDMIKLGELSQQMLQDSLESFVECNEAVAEHLPALAQQAAKFEELVRQQIMQLMAVDVRLIEAGVALIDVAHMLKRVGDRATNIGERTVYIKTATIVELGN